MLIINTFSHLQNVLCNFQHSTAWKTLAPRSEIKNFKMATAGTLKPRPGLFWAWALWDCTGHTPGKPAMVSWEASVPLQELCQKVGMQWQTGRTCPYLHRACSWAVDNYEISTVMNLLQNPGQVRVGAAGRRNLVRFLFMQCGISFPALHRRNLWKSSRQHFPKIYGKVWNFMCVHNIFFEIYLTSNIMLK